MPTLKEKMQIMRSDHLKSIQDCDLWIFRCWVFR